MKRWRTPTQEQGGALIAMAAVIFGGWVRLLIPWMAGFPVNDGGLFYVMVRAIQANGLRIPAYVQYNGINIPFAYPPLGLYTGALISTLFRVDPIKVLQWLPAIVLIGTLPAFYMLAKSILDSSLQAGIATLMYAFTPRAITWQIMGGGLTRSFGQLFLLLALACIYQCFTKYSRKWLLLSIVFCSLVVLAHPEAALQTAAVAIPFWAFRGRTKQSTLHAVAIGAGTIVVSAIWWLPLALGPGLRTLLSAGQTGFHNGLAIFQPFLLNFVDEPLMTLVTVLGMIGFAVQAAKGQFLFPIWFILPFIAEPRSAPTVAMIPLALLAGIALSDVILPALADFERGTPRAQFDSIFQGRVVQVFLVFIGLYMLGSTSYFGAQIAGTTLRPSDREAFDWIANHTPTGSKFLVLTGSTALFCDSAQEWFPALTNRVSLSTIQGKEWQQGENFDQVEVDSQAVQNCLSSSAPLECIESLASSESPNLDFDYLFVSKSAPVLTSCLSTDETSMMGDGLITELKLASRYRQVYESEDSTVFERIGALGSNQVPWVVKVREWLHAGTFER